MSMAPINNKFQVIDNNKFSIVPAKGKEQSVLGHLLSRIAGNDQRLEFHTLNGKNSVAIRTSAPPSVLEHKWLRINIKDASGANLLVWVNINSVAKRMNLQPADIKGLGNAEGLMNLNAQIKPDIQAKENERLAFNQLADEANASSKNRSLVTGEQLFKAKAFLDNPKNSVILQEMLSRARAKGNDYVVLPKRFTGLSHNIEYGGPGIARLRYQKNFARGSFKTASKMVDLYSNKLLVKTKVIIDEGRNNSEANEYRFAKGKPAYITQAEQLASAERETRSVVGVKGFVQPERSHVSTKETRASDGSVARVTKHEVYAELQAGKIEPGTFKNDKDKKEVSKEIVMRLSELHQQKLCNNDLKGDNYTWKVVDGKVTAKLIDAGFMRKISDRSLYYAGTPHAMAPEVLYYLYRSDKPNENDPARVAHLNAAKDAFGLGTALLDVWNVEIPWETYTNSMSYNNRNEDNQRLIAGAMQKMGTMVPLPDSMPDNVKQVIWGLLHPSPWQRMTADEASRLLNS